MVKILSYTLAIAALLLGACNEGLSPEDKAAGEASFGGTITVKGGVEAWPDSTEMFGIRVAAFKTSNPSSLVDEVINQNAYFTFLSIGENFEEANYRINVPDAPVKLVYTVVAWQFEDSLTSQRVAAVYGGSEPQEFTLQPGDSLTGIDFEIDFENLPEQPF